MKKMKIGFLVECSGIHISRSSDLSIIQHLCVENGFDIGKMKEGFTYMYDEGSYEDNIDTFVVAFSENEEELALFGELIEKLSQYYITYESEGKRSYEGYPEMEKALFELLLGHYSGQMLVERNEGFGEIREVPTYFLLEGDREVLAKAMDTIKEWEVKKGLQK